MKKNLELLNGGTISTTVNTTIIPQPSVMYHLPTIRYPMNVCPKNIVDFNRKLITDENLNNIWQEAKTRVDSLYQIKDDLGLSYTVKFFKLPWTEPVKPTKYIIVENNRVVKLWTNRDRLRFKLDVKVSLYYSMLGVSTPLEEHGETTINGVLFYYMIFTKIKHTDDYFTLRKKFQDSETRWNTFTNYLHDNTNAPVELNDGGNMGVDDCGRWFNYDNDLFVVREDVLTSKEKRFGNKKRSAKIGTNPKKAIYYYAFEQSNLRYIIRD